MILPFGQWVEQAAKRLAPASLFFRGRVAKGTSETEGAKRFAQLYSPIGEFYLLTQMIFAKANDIALRAMNGEWNIIARKPSNIISRKGNIILCGSKEYHE